MSVFYSGSQDLTNPHTPYFKSSAFKVLDLQLEILFQLMLQKIYLKKYSHKESNILLLTSCLYG